MKLFSYVVTHDSGFAPNPFWDYCTLANCKPTIRRTASLGDWIVGLSSKANGNRLIYAMQVDEILSYERYYCDKRFSAKIPDYSKGKVIYERGDNSYKPLLNGEFQQLQSMHSNKDGTENNKLKIHDLGGVYVLISKTFHYFGSRAPKLPESLTELIALRGHKNRFSPNTISKFLNFIITQPKGLIGPPSKWRDDLSCGSDIIIEQDCYK